MPTSRERFADIGPRYQSVGLCVMLCASGCEERPAIPVTGTVSDSVSDSVLVPAGVLHTEGGAVHHLDAFRLDRTLVTTTAFARFVEETGHLTSAEREGDGEVLDLRTGRFAVVHAATYQRPRGPDAEAAHDSHPVTQVDARDASAYCAHRGGRLPTELEWEHAARNGRDERHAYPWGDEPYPGGRARANTWEGVFPTANTLRDGHLFVSPVDAFPASPLGLRDAVGNVWQWTSSPFDARAPEGQRAIRGGSHLCDHDVCHGFRIDARQGAEPDGRFSHVGFRCAYDER